MLTELHIENLGVIESVTVSLGAGLVAVTGETGAGKTMIVEAIALLMGGRADSAIVRPGANEMRVEGRFVDAEGERIVARVVPVDGRSRAYVNGRLATVAQLAEIGTQMVDIHGQHAHQGLLSASEQRDALDVFGGIDVSEMLAARERLIEIDAILAALGGDERARAREIDLLRFQVEEIDAAGISGADEDAQMEQLESVLADATSIRESGWESVGIIAGDDGVVDVIGRAVATLGSSSVYADVVNRLRTTQQELADVAGEVRLVVDNIDDDPHRLDWVRSRRQLLLDLRRKYGDSLDEVMAFGSRSRDRLEELETYEARALTVEAQRSAAMAELAAAQGAVSRARRACAPLLAQAVEKHLRRLAMQHASVVITVEGDAGERVTFQLSANPGSAPQPLVKIASGGELARTMLALRLVLSAGPPTAVFDEVDAGIGGEAAVVVAEALRSLSAERQVLVVTHLPQVAAVATEHLVVRKEVRTGSTSTTVALLTPDERVSEVARMLSGGLAETAALQHARELLKASQGPRKPRR
jgi:DNA repair protein RecN (Recombination protein N)